MFSRLFALAALASPLSAQDGQQLFTLYCSACHAADGKGATGGTFPPLAGSPWVADAPDRAVKIVLKGLTGPVEVLGKPYNLEMPPQGATLPDSQIAAILTYVRSAWGNQGSAVSEDFVKTTRAALEARSTPWTSEEILKLHPLPLEKTALRNLISQAYSGQWNSMPDFSKLKATNVEEEHDGTISLKKAPFEHDFALVWEGTFEAPTAGKYLFMLDADDAATVLLDGKKITEVTGSGPINGGRGKTGNVDLSQGSHPFRVEYLEIKGQKGLSLGWRKAKDKGWNWLTDEKAQPGRSSEPIVVGPENGRAVIYRNFITGISPRAIGVGFPGGVNLAYSADDLAAELIWKGEFIDGAPKWVDRGTAPNPPAGVDLVKLTTNRFLPETARFRGYKLDAAGNPTFSVQVGEQFLQDSWQAAPAAQMPGLIRKLAVSGKGPAVEFLISNTPAGKSANPQELTLGDQILLSGGAGHLAVRDGKTYLTLSTDAPVILTYRWK